MSRNLIVSRHPAAVEFVRREMPEVFGRAEVLTGNVTPSDVRGRVVAGVLPMHLAALTARFYAVEFSGRPPRGAELTLAQMRQAGARLQPYRVIRLRA